jgi:hypothetical protein
VVPSDARGRAARAMHELFFENLRNPARSRRAGLKRQFRSGQLDSSRDNSMRTKRIVAAAVLVATPRDRDRQHVQHVTCVLVMHRGIATHNFSNCVL